MMNVISNTTVISNFAAINQLELLRQLYGIVYLPTEVYAEIKAGLEEGYLFYHPLLDLIAANDWLCLVSLASKEELSYFRSFPNHLHQGETACLAIAKTRGWLLLTDDKPARQEATRLGVAISGSLGCLVLAIERNVCSLTLANQWLLTMIEQGYRSPVTDLTPLLKTL